MTLIDGYIFEDGGLVRGHVIETDGDVEMREGPSRDIPDLRGVVVPMMVDAHTHCADAGVKAEPGMSLEDLVAPPDGLKHRYLRSTPREKLVQDMHGFGTASRDNGIARFVDFREGGADGCRMAREACPDAVVLGRPLSKEYDPEEIRSILEIADGIAISSISDMDVGYIEKVAEQTHKAGKAFAIHASERIREDIEAVLSLEPEFIVHMVEATVPDLKKCADLDIPIAVCPRSNRFFGKAPPLATMMECGNTVALGTDNAMLCTPDLRPEAGLCREILGRSPGSDAWIWGSMVANGWKLLYRTRKITTQRDERRQYAVLPFEGETPENAWSADRPVSSI